MSNKFLGSTSGLSIISDAGQSDITSDYNTGVMALPSGGGIKLAALCDAEGITDSVVGTDLTSTGVYYDNGRLTSYTYTNGATSCTLTDDPATIDGYLRITFSGLVVGETYVMEIQGDNAYIETSGYYNMFLRPSGAVLVTATSEQQGSTEAYGLTFTAVETSVHLLLYSKYAGTLTYTFSIKLATPDRSVNNNGLQVNGTLTKSPVATGADLQAWSGFSATDYLEQPYNSDLDFGVGDFYICGWLKCAASAAVESIINRYDGSGAGWLVEVHDSSAFRFYVTDDGFSSYEQLLSSYVVDDNVWRYFCITRSSNTVYMYINGVLHASTPLVNAVASLDNTDCPLTLGAYGGGNPLTNGSLALWRIGAGAPTADDIKYIYNQEKPMFRAGAKSTLAGSSDAITALDWNSYKQQLYAGTSGGLSKFSGLVRTGADTSTAITTIASEDIFEVIT